MLNERAKHQREVKAVEMLAEAMAARDHCNIEAAIRKLKECHASSEVYAEAEQLLQELKAQQQLRQALIGERASIVTTRGSLSRCSRDARVPQDRNPRGRAALRALGDRSRARAGAKQAGGTPGGGVAH